MFKGPIQVNKLKCATKWANTYLAPELQRIDKSFWEGCIWKIKFFNAGRFTFDPIFAKPLENQISTDDFAKVEILNLHED